MKKNVLVHNKSVHIYDRNQPQDTIEVLVPGIYYYGNDRHHLRYEEQLEDHGNPVTNYLEADGEEMTITRKGAVQTKMTFRTGVLSLFVYETPHGVFQMGVRTHEYRMSGDDERLQFDLHYTLENNGRTVSECLMRITVTQGADRD
ncbi:MAG: DUF1934 domain-containing protein [Blautia sp.]|nr:DUF1934 domain-containing protein [Blautia sp.]